MLPSLKDMQTRMSGLQNDPEPAMRQLVRL